MIRPVYIRVDANSTIGYGHLVRCISLAQVLIEGFRIVFACKTIPTSFKNEIISLGMELIVLVDENDLISLLKPDDIVVTDSYELGEHYHQQIKQTGAKLACIDDLHEQKFIADLIINHAPGTKESDYDAQPYTKFALGIQYALLRPVFLRQAEQVRIIESVRTVFICFGGTDMSDLIAKIIRLLLPIDLIKKIIVVTGDSSNEALKLLFENDRIIHYHDLSGDEMLNLMLDAELAIVPSSSVCIEAFAAGMKIITGITADNQKFIYNGVKDHADFEGIGNFNELHESTFLQAVEASQKNKPGREPLPPIRTKLLLQLFQSLN